MEKVAIKSSTINWTGKKVLGKHHGTIDLKEGYFEKGVTPSLAATLLLICPVSR